MEGLPIRRDGKLILHLIELQPETAAQLSRLEEKLGTKTFRSFLEKIEPIIDAWLEFS